MTDKNDYWYGTFNPRSDITIYELSVCLAEFGDLSETIILSNEDRNRIPGNALRHVLFSSHSPDENPSMMYKRFQI